MCESGSPWSCNIGVAFVVAGGRSTNQTERVNDAEEFYINFPSICSRVVVSASVIDFLSQLNEESQDDGRRSASRAGE